MDVIAFEDHLISKGLSDRSIGEYRKFARRLQLWAFRQGLELRQLTARDLRAWSNTLPASWATRKQARTSVTHLLRFLGMNEEDARAILVPRKPRSSNRALTHDGALQLRRAAMLMGGRAGCAVMIALHTGARRAEIAQMRWDGVDLEGLWIHWEGVKHSDPGDMPLHVDVAAMLAKLPRHSDFLFPGDRGRPHVRPETVWQWVRDVSRVAGLDPVATHRLRHTAISEMYAGTLDVKAAMEFARHRDMAVTSVYVDQPVEVMHEAVRGLYADRPIPN